MLVLKSSQTVIEDDNYVVKHAWDGSEEELSFRISAFSKQNVLIHELSKLVVTETKQEYIVTSKKNSTTAYNYTAVLDLSELKAQMHVSYDNQSNTPSGTISSVLPTGWTVLDESNITTRRTITGEGYTDLDVIEACISTWSTLGVQYSVSQKVVHLYNTESQVVSGVYLTEELNLREKPKYTGSTDQFYTRIYPVGAAGLTVESVNSGKTYIDDNSYTDTVISYFWKDERYTVAQNLYDDAVAKLKVAAIPSISYETDIIDLAKKDPEHWAFQEMQLYKIVTLLDGDEKRKIQHRVVEYEEHPKGHENENKITLSTLPQKLSTKTKEVYDSITNSSSDYQSKVTAQISSMDKQISDLITGASGGHIVIDFGDDGKTAEFLCMDTADKATAKNVIRLNNEGMAFSTNGCNGPFNAAIDITGKLMSQWISTWSLTANVITAGILKSVDGKSFFNLDTGKVQFTGDLKSTYSSNGQDLYADLWAATYKMLWADNLRVRMYMIANDGGGMLQLFSGTEKEDGTEDDTTHVSVITPWGASIGTKNDGTSVGTLYTETLQITKIRPSPTQNTLYTNWVRITAADGSSQWALCGKDTPW